MLQAVGQADGVDEKAADGFAAMRQRAPVATLRDVPDGFKRAIDGIAVKLVNVGGGSNFVRHGQDFLHFVAVDDSDARLLQAAAGLFVFSIAGDGVGLFNKVHGHFINLVHCLCLFFLMRLIFSAALLQLTCVILT